MRDQSKIQNPHLLHCLSGLSRVRHSRSRRQYRRIERHLHPVRHDYRRRRRRYHHHRDFLLSVVVPKKTFKISNINLKSFHLLSSVGHPVLIQLESEQETEIINAERANKGPR